MAPEQALVIVELRLAADDEQAALRYLRHLLRRLDRDAGARCTAIRVVPRASLSQREALDLAQPMATAPVRLLAAVSEAPAAAQLAVEAAGMLNRALSLAGLPPTHVTDETAAVERPEGEA